MFNQKAIQPGISIADRFVLQEQIGAGRMSSVYSALDSGAGDAMVAVKILNTSHPDEIKWEVFKRETAALKRLNHSNIVGLRQSGQLEGDGPFYLVLDYLPHSLDSYLKGNSKLSPGAFDQYRVMRELAEALAYAHSQNIIHRDIKPSNIMLDENGCPYLTDFGISKLLTHLTVGETLAGFWSAGYAAPEQQAAKPANFKSDIYSLGAVFYHMLSGNVPPPEGPRPVAVGNYISGQPQIRAVLERMLAEVPEERKYTGPSLVAALEGITRQVEVSPNHSLILTRTSINSLLSGGYIPIPSFEAAAAAINSQLGGDSIGEVHIQQDHRDRSKVHILGDSVRLICTPDKDVPNALAVLTVEFPYLPVLERDKERAMLYRASWRPVAPGSGVPINSDINTLIEGLADFESAKTVQLDSRHSRRDFIDRWRSALSKEERLIAEGGLRYQQVKDAGDCLQFILSESPPDNLNWPDEAHMAVVLPSPTTTGRPRFIPVGNLDEIRGQTVSVYKENQRLSRPDTDEIPNIGHLVLNSIANRSANNRKQNAVRKFQSGESANPALADVIVEPGRATHMPFPSLDYYQDWLSDDKKEAVSKAISSNELFLIQGPPGTGKTAVIAEIVLQVLKRNPDARILLSSQSNDAVNHALTQIAKAAGNVLPEMIRLGRPEKIRSENWTIERRASILRQDVTDKCTTVLDDLGHVERRARADTRTAGAVADTYSQIEDGVAVWVEEAKELIAELRECERQHEIAQRSHNRTILMLHVNDQMEDIQARLKSQLDALAGLMSLQIEYTGTNASEVLNQIIRASAVLHTTSDDDLDVAEAEVRKTQKTRSIIHEWMQVAGQTPDIMRLIVEQSNVVAATCQFSGSKTMPEASFDLAIIDEAGRATVPEVLIPITKAQRIILVGDERQLPPMVDAAIVDSFTVGTPDDVPLDTSLFQTLVEQAEQEDHWHLVSLRRQYRMHAAIGNLISQVFYDGSLEQGRTEDSFQDYEWLPHRVSWISTSVLNDRGENQRGPSFVNLTEAKLILQWLRTFEEQCRQRDLRPEVGIISGYQAQVEHLDQLIDAENGGRWHNLSIEVATVDAFQGRECDVVLYSTVRSNNERRIGFLRDYRRINVALSRARDMLVIVGDDFMMRNAEIGM